MTTLTASVLQQDHPAHSGRSEPPYMEKPRRREPSGPSMLFNPACQRGAKPEHKATIMARVIHAGKRNRMETT